MTLTEAPGAGERAATLDLLAALVRCDSVNPPGITERPAALCEAALRGAGLPVRRVEAAAGKPNLVATLDNGPGRHLVLNAHLDTVPPGDLAAWTHPPLDLTECGGRLHGLGTGNMKAAAAAMVMAMARLHRARGSWSGRVTLTLVADECTFGPDGAAHLLAVEPGLRGDGLICGEGPGAMNLGLAEKGLMWVRLTATGRVGQGMLTALGTSAPARLAVALAAIDGWNDLRAAPPLAALDHPANAEGMRLSANVGRIEGGAGFSPAVSRAEAQVDFRLPPGMTRAAVAARLDALCGEGLSWAEVKGWEPNWSPEDCAPAVAVRRAAAAVRGAAPRPVTRLPASDASRWRALGVPAVCFGPQPGLASGTDDYVNARDLLDCIAIYAGAAVHLLHPAG